VVLGVLPCRVEPHSATEVEDGGAAGAHAGQRRNTPLMKAGYGMLSAHTITTQDHRTKANTASNSRTKRNEHARVAAEEERGAVTSA